MTTSISSPGLVRVTGEFRAKPLSSKRGDSSKSELADAIRGKGGGGESAVRSEPSDALVRNAQGRLEIAAAAAEEIATLRDKQRLLAKRAAEETVDGRTFSALQTEFDTIDTEVIRVANNATYNGGNVFDEPTQTIASSHLNFSTATSTPSIVAVKFGPDTQAPIGNIVDAADGYDEASRQALTAKIYSADQSSRSSQANKFLDEFAPPSAEETIQSPSDTASGEAARAEVKDIANEAAGEVNTSITKAEEAILKSTE